MTDPLRAAARDVVAVFLSNPAGLAAVHVRAIDALRVALKPVPLGVSLADPTGGADVPRDYQISVSREPFTPAKLAADTAPLDAKVRSFADLDADWDSYGAEPPDPAIIESASTLATALDRPAQAVPGSDGSIAFEWHNGDASVVLSVEPDGDVSLYVRAGEKEWETAAFPPAARLAP